MSNDESSGKGKKPPRLTIEDKIAIIDLKTANPSMTYANISEHILRERGKSCSLSTVCQIWNNKESIIMESGITGTRYEPPPKVKRTPAELQVDRLLVDLPIREVAELPTEEEVIEAVKQHVKDNDMNIDPSLLNSAWAKDFISKMYVINDDMKLSLIPGEPNYTIVPANRVVHVNRFGRTIEVEVGEGIKRIPNTFFACVDVPMGAFSGNLSLAGENQAQSDIPSPEDENTLFNVSFMSSASRSEEDRQSLEAKLARQNKAHMKKMNNVAELEQYSDQDDEFKIEEDYEGKPRSTGAKRGRPRKNIPDYEGAPYDKRSR